MNFTIVTADDWQGVYLEGELLTENHSISASELLRCIHGYRANFGPRIITEIKEVDEWWLSEEGRLPSQLSDVKFAS